MATDTAIERPGYRNSSSGLRANPHSQRLLSPVRAIARAGLDAVRVLYSALRGSAPGEADVARAEGHHRGSRGVPVDRWDSVS